MTRKLASITADPSDDEDFDAGPAEVARGLLAREVRVLRQESGLSQPDFAARYGLALGTLRDWEQARAAPPLYAVAFLRVGVRGGEAPAEVEAVRALVA